MSAFGCNPTQTCCALPTTDTLIELNKSCYCLPIDRAHVEAIIEDESLSVDMPALLAERPHFFASTAVFISDTDIEAMQTQISTIERTVQLPAYQEAVWARGPDDISQAQPQTRGAFMSYDFHITPDGPRLIEINSNAGGAFIANVMHKAVGTSGTETEQRIYDMFQTEWDLAYHHLAERTSPLRSVAIVDQNPTEQFHYPDMCLAAKLFEARGLDVVIVDPRELRIDGKRLFHKNRPIDLIYNRSTDFALETPENAVIRRALLEDLAVVTPAPRHHALFADKRNLTWLSDAVTLSQWSVPDTDIQILKALPQTLTVTADNTEELWAERRHYFFKPHAGFGSRGSYRGAKLTRKVWAQICEGGYVAQAFMAPPLRAVTHKDTQTQLKFDVRVYTYDGTTLLLAARIYQGQTTNMRTQGGGLAPVMVIGKSAVS